MDFQPGITDEGTSRVDNLIAGSNHQTISRSITLLSGQNVLRGAVLGTVTSTGKFVLSASASTNGSQTPKAIAAEDCNATSGDKTLLVYIAGEFNENEIILGTGHTVASIREGLRSNGIFLKPSVPN